MTLPSADAVVFPSAATPSSAAATMATSAIAQSRTPPLSLSPAYSSETSPALEASDQALQDVLMSAVNSSNSSSGDAQFLSFLNLSSNAAATAVTTSPSTRTQVPGLTLSGSSGIRKSAAASRAKKGVSAPAPSTVTPSTAGDLDVFDHDAPEDEVTIKRQRNSLAARKYRQKKIDRISELESEVGQLQEERDTLRIKLARQEAETAALREMLMVRDRDRDSDSDNNNSGSSKRRRKR